MTAATPDTRPGTPTVVSTATIPWRRLKARSGSCATWLMRTASAPGLTQTSQARRTMTLPTSASAPLLPEHRAHLADPSRASAGDPRPRRTLPSHPRPWLYHLARRPTFPCKKSSCLRSLSMSSSRHLSARHLTFRYSTSLCTIRTCRHRLFTKFPTCARSSSRGHLRYATPIWYRSLLKRCMFPCRSKSTCSLHPWCTGPRLW